MVRIEYACPYIKILSVRKKFCLGRKLLMIRNVRMRGGRTSGLRGETMFDNIIRLVNKILSATQFRKEI